MRITLDRKGKGYRKSVPFGIIKVGDWNEDCLRCATAIKTIWNNYLHRGPLGGAVPNGIGDKGIISNAMYSRGGIWAGTGYTAKRK